MKLKIKYENKWQEVEVDINELRACLNVSLITEKEIQEEFNRKFNNPDYNNWHQMTRHRGYTKKVIDKDTGLLDSYEPLPSEVKDKKIFYKYELEDEELRKIEEIEKAIRAFFGKKEEWAELFIQIRFNKIPIREYAKYITPRKDKISDKEYKKQLDRVENNISKKVNRATEKIKKYLLKTSDFNTSCGYLVEALMSSNKNQGGHKDDRN